MSSHINLIFLLQQYNKLKRKRLLFCKRFDEKIKNSRKIFKRRQRYLFHQYNYIYQQFAFEYCKSVSSLNVSFRSIKYYERSETVWKSFIDESCTDMKWKSAFRISKQSFFELVDILNPILAPKPNNISNQKRIISVEKQLAITLFKLASCSEYRVVGNIFGIHKSTVQQVFYKVINSMNELLPQFITLPGEPECEKIAKEFQKICGIPQIVGCIDGTHIPITPPADGYRDFINRKGWASTVLQLVVDNRIIIRDVSCILPGSVHDAYAFKKSTFSRVFPRILAKKTTIQGHQVPYLIIGDPAYPLLNWLMKDYAGNDLPTKSNLFNTRLNKARVLVEVAIGRLKSRWRLLQKRSDINYKFMPKVIGACCMLHNIAEKSGEKPQEFINSQEVEIVSSYTQPSTSSHTNNSIEGNNIRDALATYLYNQFVS